MIVEWCHVRVSKWADSVCCFVWGVFGRFSSIILFVKKKETRTKKKRELMDARKNEQRK